MSMLLSLPCTEAEILELLANGSEFCFSFLFNNYYHKVLGIARSFLKSNVWAEEVAQDVFMKVWLKRGELSAVKHFDAYLSAMTRNLILDNLKKKSRETSAIDAFTHTQSIAETINTADHLLRNREYERLLRNAISHLTPQQKRIYHLSREEGLSQEAIAAQLKISRFTIKKHMAMALQSIRKHMAPHFTVYSILIIEAFIL